MYLCSLELYLSLEIYDCMTNTWASLFISCPREVCHGQHETIWESKSSVTFCWLSFNFWSPLCLFLFFSSLCMKTSGDMGLIPWPGRSPGEGNGHSSILAWEIPWREEATVHGVAKSGTQLSDSTTTAVQCLAWSMFSVNLTFSPSFLLNISKMSEWLEHLGGYLAGCVEEVEESGESYWLTLVHVISQEWGLGGQRGANTCLCGSCETRGQEVGHNL